METCFAYLLEVSVLNAYILQKTSSMCGKEQDYLNFRQGLAVELVGTSRRSQGGRPRTFEHSQLLRQTIPKVIFQNVLH